MKNQENPTSTQVELMDIDLETASKLWKFLPSDYAERVAKKFNVSKSTASWVRNLKPDYKGKMRSKTKDIIEFMINLVQENSERNSSINQKMRDAFLGKSS